jgi:hypothetical protein
MAEPETNSSSREEAAALWHRIISALAAKNTPNLALLTEREIAAMVKKNLGTDLIFVFVEDYFQPIMFGDSSGRIGVE